MSARALHLERQLEVADFAALPDEVNRARRFLARRFDDNRAVFHAPVAVAAPAGERLSVEERRPSVVLREVDRIGLAESSAATPRAPWRAPAGVAGACGPANTVAADRATDAAIAIHSRRFVGVIASPCDAHAAHPSSGSHRPGPERTASARSFIRGTDVTGPGRGQFRKAKHAGRQRFDLARGESPTVSRPARLN